MELGKAEKSNVFYRTPIPSKRGSSRLQMKSSLTFSSTFPAKPRLARVCLCMRMRPFRWVAWLVFYAIVLGVQASPVAGHLDRLQLLRELLDADALDDELVGVLRRIVRNHQGPSPGTDKRHFRRSGWHPHARQCEIYKQVEIEATSASSGST